MGWAGVRREPSERRLRAAASAGLWLQKAALVSDLQRALSGAHTPSRHTVRPWLARPPDRLESAQASCSLGNALQLLNMQKRCSLRRFQILIGVFRILFSPTIMSYRAKRGRL